MSRSVVFDLDGTLVDSSQGILNSFLFAFNQNRIEPAHPLSLNLIGPPLNETLRFLCSDPRPIVIEQLAASFRSHYDLFGFQQSYPFDGVCEMLSSLKAANLSLHIVTNKRSLPTSKILHYLGWNDFFDSVISPDFEDSILLTKTSMLALLVDSNIIKSSGSLYIGDRHTDWLAATNAGIPFAFAGWGFESDYSLVESDSPIMNAPSAKQVISLLSD